MQKLTVGKFGNLCFLMVLFFFVAACREKNDLNNLLHPVKLRCEQLIDPIGIDVVMPRLSWISKSTQRLQKQSSYRIIVASSHEKLENGIGDLWDSGKIDSDQSINVIYKGKALTSEVSCYWKVKLWDKNGIASDWSSPAFWTMGLLSKYDWKGKWIGIDRAVGNDDPNNEFPRLSARMARKNFKISKKVKSARAYVCGLGLFEFYINGDKIGNQVLAPALSEFSKRAYYMTFDVTKYLRENDNIVGVILGNGRYFSPRLGSDVPSNNYGFPKFIVQLNIDYTDGSQENIISDSSWKLTTDGPIVANNEYDGEEYNANKEIPGWNKPGFDDAKWLKAEIVTPGSPELCAQMIEPIRIKEIVKPVSVKEISPGVFVYDMGQNMVGWVSLTVQGEKGCVVKMRFAENIDPNGHLNTSNLRTAKATDIYTLKGGGREVFEPRFTYHGFRYVEVKGFPWKPDLSAIQGKVIYDDLQTTGTFTTSNKTINAIFRNACWGIRGNYRSIPTDCPQRDERQGWLGDRAIGSKGESFVFDNSNLYAKWMQDINDAQLENGSIPDVAPTYWTNYSDNVTWPGTYLIISDMLYDQYSDIEPIRKHYESFRKWILYMKSKYLRDGILIKDSYGDWCVPPESPLLIHSNDPKRRTSGEIVGTTYFYHMLTLMQRFAQILNKPTDGEEYKKLASQVYESYNNQFYNNSLKCYGNNTATANLLSLAFGMVPDAAAAGVFNNVVEKTMGDFDGHISTGLVGAQWIMRTTTKYGRPDIAFLLATNEDYPGWGYMPKNGATTIWELWNGNTADPAMNSGNHVMLLGDLLIWFYENLAGIRSDPESPGFKHIIMEPVIVGDLNFVKVTHESVYGLIASDWNISDGKFKWEITIPSNTTATIYIPANGENDVSEGGLKASKAEGVKYLRFENGKSAFEIGAGNYHFVSDHFILQKSNENVTQTPMLNPKDTIASNPMMIEMSGVPKDAKIRFTRDGSDPDFNSELYQSPFTIDRSTLLTARAFCKDAKPSFRTQVTIDIYDSKVNGLNYTYYEGAWDSLPDFRKLKPKRSGVLKTPDLLDIGIKANTYALTLDGFLIIDKEELYTIYLTSDDGSKLFIDNNLAIDNDGAHGMSEKSCAIKLSAGKHKIKIEYFQGEGGEGLKLAYRSHDLPQQIIPFSKLFINKNPNEK
jgi:alpha-L-rhamnosidase